MFALSLTKPTTRDIVYNTQSTFMITFSNLYTIPFVQLSQELSGGLNRFFS
jgi:hypothetical protein